MRLIRLVWVTVVALLLLLNDECKLESLQEDGSRTRQEIPRAACCKAIACKCCVCLLVNIFLLSSSAFLSQEILDQWFSKWEESFPWGDFEGQEAIKPKGEIGGKQHKGGKNAQPLFNHWVNFNSLLLWYVSFLQILIYYDIHWSLLLKQLSFKFLLWIVCVSGYSVEYFHRETLF